jgi:DNA-directed RNA polymerases I, II, and III subunit RPABC2
MSSVLEEVDVEQQLEDQEGEDSPVIKINTEVNDEDDNKKSKFKVGDLVIDMLNFKSDKEVQPIYIVKAINENGKYIIEQQNVEEGQDNNTPYEIDEDDLTPVNPESPEGPYQELNIDEPDNSTNLKFELSVEQQKMVDDGIKEEEEEKLNEITDDEDDDDGDESDDGDEFKKLENDISRDYLLSYHPELKQINYAELLSLSKITRNKNGVIIDPLHKTFPYLTKFERAKILGQRAKQINNGSSIFVKVTPNIIDGHTIALMELNQKKIPFIIKRPLPNGVSEYWKVSDLNMLE